MFSFLAFAFALVSCVQYESILAINVQKYSYQKDISEHCRRRVMPSVFLGKHVVDANSQILHFTKLELPYSCFISVRSESGTNVILVVQIESDANLVSSCLKNGHQLLVYEMGETFGGYWGPLSDSIIRRERHNHTKYYTQKTTQEVEPSTVESDDEDTETTTETANTGSTDTSDDSGDYIRVEMPIVNVSGKLVPGEVPRKNVFDIDESFDFIYDVTPRPGTAYDTSIVPLVQFSIKKNINIQRIDNEDNSKYELKYDLNVTPDERLLFSTRNMGRNKHKKQKYNANKRINFKTTKSYLTTYRRHLYTVKPLTLTSQYVLTKRNNVRKHKTTTENVLTINEKKYTNISWEFINDLMKMYNETAPTTTTKQLPPTSYNISNLFKILLDTKHNSSVYLSPNLSVYYKDVPLYASITRKSTTLSDSTFRIIKEPPNIVVFPNETLLFTMTIEKSSELHLTQPSNAIRKSESPITIVKPNITVQDEGVKNFNISKPTLAVSSLANSINSPTSNRTGNLSGSLVDHESWENVVQVAPVMAGLLNTNINQSQDIQDVIEVKKNKNRKKRYIQSVHIQDARPHNITTRGGAVTTADVKYGMADMQDFVQLVEIQDDELHGRVGLRYLRRYVGPILLNICDYTDAARHVYLFNSSRIVIAISNFTMDQMMLVLTPARTVMTGDGRCPDDHLECQVSGARVCIDSLTACDGIPNCGSYEIYDEDRLMCGAAIGLQHNVYLAAFTFLAVLLTVLYGVHYWLKRCVPKVSDAFFLYTDGTENILYLDSIMRSPTDDDDMSRMPYQGSGFDDDLLMFSDVNEGRKINKLKMFFKSIFKCSYFRRNPKKQQAYETMAQEGLYASLEEQKKRFSYAELELRRMLESERGKRDISVQTGDSLEMRDLKMFVETRTIDKSEYKPPMQPYISDSLLVLRQGSSMFKQVDTVDYAEELSILNFFNNSKSDSSKSKSSDDTIKIKPLDKNSITSEEREIKSHHYDHKPKAVKTSINSTLSDADAYEGGPSNRIKKHLRFDDGPTTIPSVEYSDDNDEDVTENLGRRRSVVLGGSRFWRKKDLDSIVEGNENSTNTQGDAIRFWSKSKKSKKKSAKR